MRWAALCLLCLLVPIGTSALCTSDGYSIIFVNGILTSEQQASEEKSLLQREFLKRSRISGVDFNIGYNASHLNGTGDGIESVFQAFNGSISDFDFDTILNQIHSEVSTRKILLVGHSQGTFYTNQMYEYLTTHGVPKESIAVYNIATPASSVAGGGEYVTSTNDKAINYIRDKESDGNVRVNADSYYVLGPVVASALRANISIPKESGYESDGWGGHHFSVYLDGAASRIVGDMNYELQNLKVSDTATSTECFVAPGENMKYKMVATAFKALDPIDDAITNISSYAADKIANGLGSIFHLGSDTTPTSQSASPVVATAPEKPAAPKKTDPAPTPQKTAVPKPVPVSISTPEPVPSAVPTPAIPPPSETDPISPIDLPTAAPTPAQTGIPSPGYGGGAWVSTAVQTPAPQSDPAVDPVTNTVVLSVDTPDSSRYATTSVPFKGTASIGAIISASADGAVATTTTDNAGNWSIELVLAEGDTSVSFVADDAGISSDTISRTVTIDTAAPDTPVLAISDCDNTLVSALCVLPSADTTLSWTSNSADYYAVVKNGVYATTTATESTESIANNATTTFAIVAYDAAGNAATSTPIEVYGLSRAVVINEISWAGDGDPTHQWIELKNFAPFTIDLSHLAIARTGGEPIALSGTIGPSTSRYLENFLVVEPFEIRYTGSHIFIAPFSALDPSGEQLTLMWNAMALDTTPAVGACSGWCAGALNTVIGRNESGLNEQYVSLSMERLKDAPDGSLASSWQNTDTYSSWLGVTGAPAWGTPGLENSIGLPDGGVYCGDPSHLVVANQPYDTGTSECIYLSKFITGDTYGAYRDGGLYEGDVGSSTAITGHAFGKGIVSDTSDVVPSGTPAGTHFFFTIYESRSYTDADPTLFGGYFTKNLYPAPHGNYIVIPFIYEP